MIRRLRQLRAAGVLGLNRRNGDYILRYNRRSLYPLVDDKVLCKQRMLRENLPLHAAGRRYFGTWKAAVEKAGIDYNIIRGGLFGWSKVKTARALRERVVEGRQSQKHIREHSPSLFRAAMHHFGTWDEAIHQARRRK